MTLSIVIFCSFHLLIIPAQSEPSLKADLFIKINHSFQSCFYFSPFQFSALQHPKNLIDDLR